MKIPAHFEKWFLAHGATYGEIGAIMALKDTPHYGAIMAIAYRSYRRGRKHTNCKTQAMFHLLELELMQARARR